MAIAHPSYLSSTRASTRAPTARSGAARPPDRNSVSVARPGRNLLVQVGVSALLWAGLVKAIRSIFH